MRMRCLIWVALLALLHVPVVAGSIAFAGGGATVSWSSDTQLMMIEAWLDTTTPDVQSHVWILTIDSQRFADGIFAWQLHYSEAMDSVVVLPNDFLTVRHFTTAQLGIDVELLDSGQRLRVRIPVNGAIPHLIAEGDQIELHALWIQQAPLLATLVPLLNDTIASAGGGASLPEAQPTVSETQSASISTSLVPEISDYVQGVPIVHRFALADSTATEEANRVVLSYTLMRIHDGQASEFVRFSHIPYDSSSHEYAYAIETANLSPGLYRLLIDSSNSSLSARMDIEITAP